MMMMMTFNSNFSQSTNELLRYSMLINQTINNNNSNITTTAATTNERLASAFSNIRYVLLYFIYPFIIITGSTLNILTIIIFLKRELCRLNISVYTISLAVADLCVLLFPVTLNWLYDMIPNMAFFQSSFWCQTHGYIDMVFCCCSSWNVVAISYERWLTICKPMEKNVIFANKRAFINISLIIFLSFTLHAWYPFLLHGYMSYNTNLKRYEANCDIKFNKLFRVFGTLSIILIYVIPFILISILNGMIVKRICQRIRKRKRLFGINNRINEQMSLTDKIFSFCCCFCRQNRPQNIIDENASFQQESIELQSRLSSNLLTTTVAAAQTRKAMIRNNTTNSYKRRELDLAINTMLVAISIMFLILIAPFQLLWFYKEISDYQYKNHSESENLIIFILTDITLAIRNLNFAINFIFYSTLSNQFRRELILLFYCSTKQAQIITINNINNNNNNKTQAPESQQLE